MSAVSFRDLAAKAYGLTISMDQVVRDEYQKSVQRTGFWLMADLKGSAAYRSAAGPEMSYRRAITFSRLIRKLAGGYAESVTVFKELGDGVLLFSADARPLIEIACILDAVRELWDVNVLNDADFPSLDSRTAVTFGAAHQVGFDFLGSPIDQVARLSGYTTDNPNCIAVVSEEVRRQTSSQFGREYDFLEYGENVLGHGLTKAGEDQIWLSELRVDRAKRNLFGRFFHGSRHAIENEGA